VALLARVSCRSEGQGEERPVALWLGGERVAVRELVVDAVVGPASAGGPCERRVTVELEDGERLELLRRLPDGPWQVLRPRDHGPSSSSSQALSPRGGDIP
jgi:hypothetical protein